ncbi:MULTISPECIES: hypothetical protein [Vibrio]|jgi:hypothetical protein|nr:MULTISPECIES: hypothetical protein [Vibrio]EGR4314726.1 hypothetical protein [Vibrio cholerae]RFD56557.1 hypothetical protein H330_019800 [Vibrio parahaemolyticus 3631]EGQ7778938.1 hypothetical protein [Vibrio parahaemolyticus]EGQ8105414.1 hypothetical protein [Vibrio parahaemolyticus]EGQ8396243.1 hypothetical protein [Vibrio parahaemolyticus]
MNDDKQQEEFEEGSIRFMQTILQEKALASVVMGKNGNVVVQYCDSITVYKQDNSAYLAAKLLKLVAEAQEG